jgi:hypothetical protein
LENQIMGNRNWIQLVVFVALLALVLPGPAAAKRKKYERVRQFAVEFTCGENVDEFARILPGQYTMVTNVFNAGSETRARAKVSLSFPVSRESDWIRTRFDPGEAQQLNCGDILGELFFAPPPPAGGYIQGFLVIQTKGSLDVTARYTTSGRPLGGVSSDVQTVRSRSITRRRLRSADHVEICHFPPGNPDAAHTIEVGHAAVDAHISHGDHVGECDDGASVD